MYAIGPILTLLSVSENTLSPKCSLKCSWATGASWAEVGPFEHLFGCGVKQKIGSRGRFGFARLVWGATFSCALGFGVPLALVHSTQLLMLHFFLFLFFKWEKQLLVFERE